MGQKRISRAARLHQIGIGQEDLDFYFECFVQDHGRYYLKHDYKKDWYFVKSKNEQPVPITDYVILRHLAGDSWAAKRSPGRPDFFGIDIDINGESSLRERYDTIRLIFPETPIVCSSSRSGGLHVYYFLESQVWRDPLAVWLAEQLSSTLHFNPKIEYLPGSLDHLRLPLGRDSHLLDPVDLKPLGFSLSESFDFIKDHRKYHRMDLDL